MYSNRGVVVIVVVKGGGALTVRWRIRSVVEDVADDAAEATMTEQSAISQSRPLIIIVDIVADR